MCLTIPSLVTSQLDMGIFQLNVENNPGLHGFASLCFTLLLNWSRKFAPFSQPIRLTTWSPAFSRALEFFLFFLGVLIGSLQHSIEKHFIRVEFLLLVAWKDNPKENECQERILLPRTLTQVDQVLSSSTRTGCLPLGQRCKKQKTKKNQA